MTTEHFPLFQQIRNHNLILDRILPCHEIHEGESVSSFTSTEASEGTKKRKTKIEKVGPGCHPNNTPSLDGAACYSQCHHGRRDKFLFSLANLFF